MKIIKTIKNFTAPAQVRVFIAGFCSALCLAALFFAIQPKAASGDNDAIMRELRIIREEIAGIRQDLEPLLMILYIAQDMDGDGSRDAADASDIINDLRDMRAASLMLYADNIEAFHNETITDITLEMLAEYMGNPEKFQNDGAIYICGISADGRWWVGFNLENAGKGDGVRKMLSERAGSVELHGELDTDVIYTSQDIVWMFVR